jgi:hypothetical protein
MHPWAEFPAGRGSVPPLAERRSQLRQSAPPIRSAATDAGRAAAGHAATWVGRDRLQRQFIGLGLLASMPGPRWAGPKDESAPVGEGSSAKGAPPSSAWRGHSNQRRMPIGLHRSASIAPDLAEWHPSWLVFRDSCQVGQSPTKLGVRMDHVGLKPVGLSPLSTSCEIVGR